jgi:hypothetical protein
MDRIRKTLPSMCVLIIKLDKGGNPSHAKSHMLSFGILKTDTNTTQNPKDMHQSFRTATSISYAPTLWK